MTAATLGLVAITPVIAVEALGTYGEAMGGAARAVNCTLGKVPGATWLARAAGRTPERW